MAKKVKRFYWLKLKEDFFDEDTMGWLEEQDNGKEYCLFYLKLCLKSLKSDGVLVRKVGDMLIPYDIAKIAEITKTQVDIANGALNLLKQIGYIQVLDSGGLFLTQIENMTGSETDSAERQRKSRANKRVPEKGVTMSQQSHTNVTLESQNGHTEKENRVRERVKELDKDIDIEKDIEKDIDFSYFWSIYPRQVNREETYLEWIHITTQQNIDKLDLIQATRNYADNVKDFAQKFIKYPNNFLADKTYVNYLPNNYIPRPNNVIPISKPVNKFNDFPQRSYTKEEMSELEQRLINRQ